MKLDQYTLVLLRRPPNAPQYSDEELERLQKAHVAFNAQMRAEGHAVLTGPFEGQPDPSWRGLNVFRTSVEETRRLVEGDPTYQAGRFAFDIFTWYVPEGLLGDRPAAQIEV